MTCFGGDLVLTHLHCGYAVLGLLDEDNEDGTFKDITYNV